MASLFPLLPDGIEIVAFAPTVWIYSLGHSASTKQQLNLRVSGYGAEDWDRELSLTNSEVVYQRGEGAYGPPRGHPKS